MVDIFNDNKLYLDNLENDESIYMKIVNMK